MAAVRKKSIDTSHRAVHAKLGLVTATLVAQSETEIDLYDRDNRHLGSFDLTEIEWRCPPEFLSEIKGEKQC